MLYATIRDGDQNPLVGMIRCTNFGWLIPWRSTALGGNFRFESAAQDEYPDYTKFGDGCRLVFYSASEMQSMTAGG